MNMQAKTENDDFQMPEVDDLKALFEPYIVEMEQIRQLPSCVVKSLKELGVFRMLAPSEFGGYELPFPRALELVRRISFVDASIGWIAGINSGAAIVMPKLPASALSALYREGPDQVIAGSAQALGLGKRVTGGWQVSGRWPLASGCMAADWIIAGFKDCDIEAGGNKSGTMQMVLPARQYDIEDTWKVMGLRGTGSHHVSINDAFVSDDFVMTLGPGPLAIDAPLYRHPAQLIPLVHGAVHLGTAQAMLTDLVDVHRGRVNDGSGKSEVAQFALGRCHSRLRAAEASFDAQVATNWTNACANVPADMGALGETVQTLVQIASETLDVVRTCFELAGSSAIYEDSPMQRRLRDLQVATQHGIVYRTNWLAGGKALLNSNGGVVPNLPFFSPLERGNVEVGDRRGLARSSRGPNSA